MYNYEGLKNLNVLIVEDEPGTAELYSLIFDSVGAHVKIAISAKDALEKLENFLPNIVISDIYLPDVDGCWLINQIKKIMGSKGKNIKGLAITGLLEDEDKIRFSQAGFDKYLSKPVDVNDLVKVVAALAD